MRIDKYLKVARILKRRTICKELAEQERLLINDRKAKASSEVKPGDVLTIMFGHRILKVRVLAIQEHAKKEDAPLMFEVIDEQRTLEV